MVPTLQARKQQLVREAIWDAATELFDKKGFDETTVDDIAQAAGISRRSLFRYFASKNDLMAHGMMILGEGLVDVITACPANYSPFEAVRHTVREVARRDAGNPRSRKIMAIGAKYPAARAAEVSRLPEVSDAVAKAFAGRKGCKDDVTARVLAALTLETIFVTFRSWFEHGEEDIAATAELVLKALGRVVCEQKKKV